MTLKVDLYAKNNFFRLLAIGAIVFHQHFSHMRLRKPTGSLVLDRSIPDGDLARGIHALPCKSKQSIAALIVGIVPLRR